MNFDEIRLEALANLNERIEATKTNLAKVSATEKKGPNAYQSFLPDTPVVPVTINAAQNIFLDLLAAQPGCTIAQRDYCRYLVTTIPGKSFTDAQWIVEGLNKLEDPPILGADYKMPMPNTEALSAQMGQAAARVNPSEIDTPKEDDDGLAGQR